MVKDLDITLVRTFIAVAENASMTMAANTLHLTQGVISQQVRRPENAFGCRLFEHDDRRLELTYAGERLFGHVKRLLVLNDEIQVDMAARLPQGPARLGVPYDLVGTVFPPILKAPAEAWSPVELTTVRGILPELTKRITRGELDIAVAETPMDKATDECLCMERLAWIGPCGGDAHTECPLPLSMVGGSCAFRAHVFKVLGERGIEWRTVFESGDIEAATTTVRTGLAVAAWLAPMVSADLDILGSETGPPELSMFAVNLLLPAQNVSMTVLALARCVHDGFSSRQRIGGRHAAQHVVSGYRLPPSIYMSPFGVSNASAEAGRATSDNSTYRLSSSKASHPNPWSPARMAGIFGRAS